MGKKSTKQYWLAAVQCYWRCCLVHCAVHYAAERAEMIAFNALPATITPDMWAHQYLQQSNEMNAVHSDDHVWLTDGPDSTL